MKNSKANDSIKLMAGLVVSVEKFDPTKDLNDKTLHIAMACLDVVPVKLIDAVIKQSETHLTKMKANHKTPNGDDVSAAFELWTNRQKIAIMIVGMVKLGFTKPSDIIKRIWTFASYTGAQRAGNDYLALKSQHKFVALMMWVVSLNPRADYHKNKYLMAQIMCAEVLGLDVVTNKQVYSVSMGWTAQLDSMTANVDADLRARLLDSQLYKSAGTSVTQRTTSANLLQAMNAGKNAGNERCIYFDKKSALYMLLVDSLTGHMQADYRDNK